jgi:hypothetical protein
MGRRSDLQPAVIIAIGADWEGRRNVLAVELAHRESQSSWKEFCLQLNTRGLTTRACVRPSVKFYRKPPGSGVYLQFLRNALRSDPA